MAQRFQQVGSRAGKTLGGFRTFILRGNVVDLAVGIVIGAAFTSVVTGLVKDLITPLIGLFGGFDFSTWKYTVQKSVFAPGDFINSLISFLIIAAVVYFFVVQPVNALTSRFKPHEVPAEPAPTRDCPYCLSSVPAAATRCAYCTSPLPPMAPVQPAPPQR